MKNIVFVIFFALFISESIAQDKVGVFRNFNDYMNGTIEEYAGYQKTRHIFFGGFKVVFKDGAGKEIKHKIDHEKMWGYVADDKRIFRVDDNNKPSVIMLLGDIVVYGNYTTKIEDGNATMVVNQYVPKISKGINGKMMKLTKNNLQAMIFPNSPYYEELKNCRKYMVDLVDFVKYYNREMEKGIEIEVEKMEGHI